MRTPYYNYIRSLVTKAKAFNDAGRRFPIWGTCLGFETLLMALSNGEVLRDPGIVNDEVSTPVKFSKSKDSIFKSVFTSADFNAMRYNDYFYFHHIYVFITSLTINETYVLNNIDILAQSTTQNNLKIIAAYQHRYYPFVGVQFHPEETEFVHDKIHRTNQSPESIQVARKMGRVLYNLMSPGSGALSNSKIRATRASALKDSTQGWQESYYFPPDAIVSIR